MIHNKIHLIRPGCLRLSIVLAVQNRGLKHHSFIHSYISASRQKGLTTCHLYTQLDPSAIDDNDDDYSYIALHQIMILALYNC